VNNTVIKLIIVQIAIIVTVHFDYRIHIISLLTTCSQ